MNKDNTEIFWLYGVSSEELISLGVDPNSIHEDITPNGMTQCMMTRTLAESLIPKDTTYCYNADGTCPFYDKIPHFPAQSNGYCHFLRSGDSSMGFGLLWDQCKECSISELS